MKTLKIAIRIILILFLLFIINGLDCRMKVVNYTISSDKLSSPLKIVFITDLHSSYYGKGEKRIIKKIDKFQPDVIMLGGDIYDDTKPMDITQEFMCNIGKRYRCYYVTGNHEVKSGHLDSIKNLVRSSGVRLLEKETTVFLNGRDSINICGWPDVTEEAVWKKVWDGVDSLARNCNSDNYTILLHHRPEFVEQFMEYGYDLLTAGHYHGGQFRLPWKKEGVYAPDHAGAGTYTGGLYRFDKRYAIISRGLARGNTIIPRFYIRPELVEITIVPEEKAELNATSNAK